MYWLRRVPTETRIVVVVVFLALFQAILLSVFGLGAIRREREGVAAQLAAAARQFAQLHVVDRCQTDLRDRADEVFAAAFDRRDPAWRDRGAGGGLFTDAFSFPASGGVLAPLGTPLWLPRELADEAEREAHDEAARLESETHALDEAELVERHLAFAARFPFARDDLGGSRALAHASSPLWSGEAPGAEVLLRARWVGVLNRLAGYVGMAECDSFLSLLDRRGGDDARYAAGKAEQERGAVVLDALRRERPRPPPDAQPRVHRGARGGPSFYVRRVGGAEDLQVLAIDGARLEGFLAEVLQAAARHAPEGVTPGLAAGETAGDLAPLPIPALPGYAATARVSTEVVRARAADRERFYWYIIAFSVAGILAGGLLTARVVQREMRLAKLKSGFVSNVSHGLKTPLTSIRMFSDMLRSGQVTEERERKECLDVIAQETERLGRLIQQVLDFGRLEANRRTFRWTTASPAAVVQRETERFRRATGLKEDVLVVRIDGDVPPVTHDPEALGEALANLLSNAYKYTDVKRRRIEVTLGSRQGRVVLAVEDNGPGIPVRERRKIFEQFYRADDLLTREVEGTGLGLSIARNIVQAHGGTIRVEDGHLEGSRFAILLPAAALRRPPRAPLEAAG